MNKLLQVIIINMHNPKWIDYLKEFNELLKNGWIITSQICTTNNNEAVFSYIVEYNEHIENAENINI